MKKLQTLWQAVWVPLLGVCMVLVIYAIWGWLDLPPREALIEVMRGLIEKYGYIIVFFGAFIESLLVIGWYFPGSLIIFLSVILAPNPTAAVISVAIVTAALWSGYTTNYFLGKYGWYKVLVAAGIKPYIDEAKEKLTKYGILALFTSYWSPGLASFVATAAGIMHYPAYKFLSYSLVAVILWNIFWGTLVYNLGERALTTVLSWPFMVFVVMVWIGARYWSGRKSKTPVSL